MLPYQNLASTIHGKKSHIKTIHLKLRLQHGMINLNYQMDHIMHQIFKIILSISSTYNPPTEIYVNRIENT